MPIFEYNGKKYNVKDEHIDNFMKDFPDASTIMEREGKKYRVKSADYKTFMSEQPGQTEQPEQKPTGQPAAPTAVKTPEDPVTPPTDELGAKEQDNLALQTATRSQIKELAPRVDSLLLKRGDELEAEQKRKEAEMPFLARLANNMNRGGGAAGMPTYAKTNNGRMADDEYLSLQTAARSLKTAQRIIDEADHNAASGSFDAWLERSFAGGAARGLGQKLFDPATWDMGVTDVLEERSIANALKTFEKGGELTEGQQALLDAKAIELATNAYFGSYVGKGYKAGQVTAEAIPFMLEMTINPASQMGKGAVSALTKYAFKRFGKEAAEKGLQGAANKVVNGIVRAAGDLAGAATMTATTGAVRTAADTQRRMTGDLRFSTDENTGYSMFAGAENGEEFGTAFAKAFGSGTIENYSEMIGEYFSPILAPIGKGIGKGFDWLHLGKVNQFINDVKMSEVGKIVTDFEKHAKWNGVFGEYAEEVVGGMINALTVGDQTLDSDEKTGVFNLERNIETFTSVALLGGFMSAAKTVGYRTPKHRARKELEAADIQAREKVQNWKEVKETLNSEDIDNAVYGVLSNKDLSSEQRRAILGYIAASLNYDGVVRGEAKMQGDGEQSPEQMDFKASFDNGYSLQTPVEMNDAKNMLDYKREQLRKIVGDKDIELFDNDAYNTFMSMSKFGHNWDDSALQAAREFVEAKATYDGMIQHVRDNIDNGIKESDAAIDARTNKTTGYVQGATMKVDDRRVYVISGHLVPFADGSGVDRNASDRSIIVRDAETGEDQMVSPDAILSFDEPIDPDFEKATAAEAIRMQFAQEAANKIDGVATFNPGDTYTITGDDAQIQVQIVANEQGIVDNGDGTVNVSDGTNVFPLAKETIQQQVDMANIARVTQFEQARAAENAEVNRPQYVINDLISLSDENGNSVRGSITADADADGRFEVYTESPINGKRVNLFTRDELDNMLLEHNGVEVAKTQPDNAEQTPTEVVEKEPIPVEKRGKEERVAYHVVPIERTMEEIHSMDLTPQEIGKFIAANIKEIKGDISSLEKKTPEMGADINAYKQAKSLWNEQMAALKQKLDYYTELQNRENEVYNSEMQAAVKAIKPEVVEMTADEFIANNMPKITPESFKRETGLSNSEQRDLVGVIAGADKGGMSIEQAAEVVLENYGDELRGLGFNGDVQDVRDMIINILSSGNPRSYAKKGLEIRMSEDIERQRAELGYIASQMHFETIEDQIEYEQNVNPRIIEDYKDFDEEEYFNILAQNYDRNDTTGESESIGRSGNVLQRERVIDNEGVAGLEQPGQGGKVQGDVYGGGENAASQGNQQPVISETPQPANEMQPADLTEDVKTEDVNQSENNLEMVAEEDVPVSHAELQDARAFAQAYSMNSIEAYQEYLDRFPDGAYRDAARNEIWVLEGNEVVPNTEAIERAMNVLAQMRAYNNNANALQNGNNELNLQKEDESDNDQNQNDIPVGGQIPQSVPQGEYGTQAPLPGGVQETAARLRERVEADGGTSQTGVSRGLREIEDRVTRVYAQDNGLWIPFEEVFKLGRPSKSGNEHDTYLNAEQSVIYKVNNRMNTPSILDLLDRMELHNKYFPDSKYSLVGFTAISKNGDVWPVFAQDYVPDARMATVDEIDDYMSKLGFTRVGDGRYSNGEVVIKDLKPRNVLVNPNGDVFVVDAEFEQEKQSTQSVGEQVQAAEAEVNTKPTDAQKEAGNYKKGHVKIGPFNISIEQPKGSVRSGVDKDGKKWEVEMQNTYGYFRSTEGVDGDHIDVFLSNDIDGWDGRQVFVVDQRNADGSFDEHKVMLGFNDINDAEAAYMSNYEEGWQGLGAITGVSIEEFEKWIASSHRKTKAFAEYKSVKTDEGQNASAERRNLADFKEGDVVRDYYDKKLYRIKKHSKNGVSTIAELDAEGNEVGTTTMNAHNNSRYSLAEAPVKAETPTISQDSEQVSDQDNAPYTIAPAQYTTKKGKVLDMHLVKIPTELNSKQSRVANSIVRNEYKGWWDKEQGGFMMRSEEDAIRFGEYLADLASQEPVELVSMDDIKAVNNGDVAFTEPKQENERIWQYSIHIDADGYTTISRDDVSSGYPIGDARFRYSTNSPEEMLDILRNPLNGMQEALEAVGVTLENKIKTRELDQKMRSDELSKIIFSSAFKDLVSEDGKHNLRITKVDGAKRIVTANLNTENVGGDGLELSFEEIANILNNENWQEKKDEAATSGNRLVTDERYAELRERMRKKLGGQMNIGIDPEILAIGTEMAVYHLEKGARKFTEFAKAMIADLGDAIRPYLKAFYNGARDLPEVVENGLSADMTTYDEVQTFDVANFDKPGIDALATAETVARETEVAKEVDVAQERIKKSRQNKDNKKNSVTSQQEQLNLFENGAEGENAAADNSGAQPGREELPDTEQVGTGIPVQDTARNSKSKRRNAGVGSSELGNGPQYDVNRNYTNEEIEEIVSSVTDIVDGKVVITGEVTDDIKAIVRGYESGGIAKKGRGILDEYYTDGKIVDAVNLLIAPYFNSSTPIRVLEPSVGIGNFIQAVNNIPTSEVVAFEINETTARIAKILYPDVDVNLRSFETEFIDESGNKKPIPQKYSLVIGNPPYGSHRGLYKGLGEESKIARYEDYFVKRSLDVLDEGGVLAMVLPSSWIDRHTKFGGYTIERAYRLPSGAFEATQVGTDIVILKKDSSVPVTEHVPYFEQFPERVLGEVKQRKGRYGRLEEYVEGDIDAAIEAIKKENAEQVADLLDIEKNNDVLNDIESAVDETGSPEKAVAIVKDAQESEKADKKPAKKPNGKQGKYKVELNRGVETVPTSSQFTHEFSDGEVEAFADTDYEGALSNPAKHRRYANYIGGQAIHDFYYAEGDIYSKLAQLEQEKGYIVENYGVEQYEKQKALLESVLPKQKSLEEITISPNTTFVKNLYILTEGGRVSLKDMFVDFLRKLPHQAFGNSSSWEVVGYINNEQVHGTDKQRNQLIRERRKRVANDLFNKFLSEELSDNAKKQVVAAFNREYNSTYRPDYSKVPMFSTINRDFKGKPLRLTSVQLAGIGRMTVKGVGVLAHEVGFGKTLSGILAMHEAMTRGFAEKPLIVVPNDNILKQWVETIGEVLPNATVNTLGNLGAGYDLTDFKVNDGEFTIITYEGLKAMSFSDGTYNHLASKFSYITEDLNKHQSERDIQKEIEKKNELKGKMKRGTKSSYMFEDFGFDWLTVDEVHNANHIVSKVRLDKSVASDFRSQSQRTSDLGLKTWLAAQYIQEENNGRNVLLLSATPFTNKPLEYYSILSLVGNDMLERKGFFNVDQFFATFMEADNELEIGANGRPTQKTNVRRFRNNGLFQQLLSEFIDIKGEEDNPELVRPERLNKEYKIAQNELTAEAMTAAQELLSDNDTVLQGIGHARAAAFSPYATALLGMQPKNHKEFVKNSPKIDATIKMIEQDLKDRPDAGQIIYSEVGVEFFPLIRDYLVKESGLKPNEVRIITGATSNNERVNIQAAFNNGEIKVVIGSPAIKEGLNLQGNTTDMYILSLPWNFTQLRQIEGRGWRQGNRWENIRINYMLTNDSVDVFMLQRLQLKQGLYNEAMKSGAESLDVSDIDTAELKTALITDPAVRAEIVTVQERAKLQQEKTQIEADLSFVMRKYEAYNKLVEKLGSQKNTIKMYREWAKKGDEYWAQRVTREEAQLANIENEIEEEKQNLLKKGVNVDDIVRQTEQAQNAIAAIQEKIDNLEELQEELTQKFREESEAKAKEQGDLISTYIKERKAENKSGFYMIRPTQSEQQQEDDDTLYRSDDTMYRIREDEAPKKTGIGYKVFVLKNGELFPPMVANPNGEATPVGVWLDADAAPIAGQSKTGRTQVKAGGKGTQGGSGKLAYRPGWHLGEIPYALQFNRNDENGERTLFPANFVWAEVEYANDVDYQEEAMSYGYNQNGKFQHSYAGLPRVPENGAYKYRTNPNPETDPWIITGAMRVKRLLTPTEVDEIVKAAGREPQRRQEGAITDKQINALNAEIANDYRDGVGAYTDDEVSFENDPISKVLGKPRFTRKQRREYAERERQRMVARVDSLAKKLNLDNVEIVTDASKLEGKKQSAKGLYSKSTGKITIVIPNHRSTFDVEQTLLHEAVAHYGLRKLFGEHFDTFLDNVFNNADEAIRRQISDLAIQKYNFDFRKATEEYLASLAENMEFENAQRTGWWRKIKELFLKMLHKIGFEGFGGTTLSDNELRYILWRSYKNLEEPGAYNNVFATAEDIAKQSELKVGNYAVANAGTQNVAEYGYGYDDDMYRDGDPEIHERVLARDRYERRIKSGWYQSQEALQDSMLGLKEAMQAILGEKTDIEDVDGFENAYLGENRLSSVNKAEADAFAHTLFKPMLDEVAKLAPTEEARTELIDYMFAKHGIERTRDMSVKMALTEPVDGKPKFKKDAYKQYLAEKEAIIANGKSWAEQYHELNALASMYGAKMKDVAGLVVLTETGNIDDAMTAAYDMVNEYERTHNTNTLWKRVNDASKAFLQKSYESGLMSKEVYNEISKMYQFYIPLRGFDEKTSADAYAYLNGNRTAFNAPIRKAEGRTSKADDPFANLQAMAESAIMQGNRNKLVKQRFLNFVLNHPSDLVSVNELWLEYDEVADEWRPVFPDNIKSGDSAEVVEQKMRDFEMKMEALAEKDPDKYKRGKDAVDIPYKVVADKDMKEHLVLVKRGGRDIVLTVNGNPRLAQALNGQTNPDNDMSGAIGAILRAGEKINRQLSAFYTTRNPDFVVSNFMRDLLYTNTMAWIKESPNYALRFQRNYLMVNPVAMKRLLARYRKGELDMNDKTDAMFYQFMMNGGETGYANIRDIEQHKNDIKRELKRANTYIPVQEAWSLLAEQLDELNRAVENCARFAAFVTSREMGRSIDRAVYDAKEISVNFNKKGSGAKFLDATGQTRAGNASAFVSGIGRSGYVFWNAAIQGTTNFGRQIKRHPAKAFTGMAAMFLLGAIIAYLGGDDEEDDKNAYYNLPEYVRRTNILFRAGDSWISIPLPIEYRAMYGMGELMMSVLSGKEHFAGEEIAEAIAAQMTQILPLDFLEGGGGWNAFVPSIAKPVVEAFVIEKSWTGMPLYKDTPFNKNKPEWTKAYKSANKYIVGLAAALNEATGGDAHTKGWIDINPAKIEYMLNGYFSGVTGTIDKMVKTVETVAGIREYDPRSIPLWNRLVKAGDERTEYRAVNNEYFRLKKEHDVLKERLRSYEKDTDNGIFDYAEKIDFLYNSPEYARYEIFEDYRKDIDDLYDELQEAETYGDKDEVDAIEAELNGLKKMMIHEMNWTRDRK